VGPKVKKIKQIFGTVRGVLLIVRIVNGKIIVLIVKIIIF
jgi:hypothetical protein